jgi:nitrous oxide reductase accessory protein NosL
VLLALLAGLLLIAGCHWEKQKATAHRSSLQKPLMGG